MKRSAKIIDDHGMLIVFAGLPATGKSELAKRLEAELAAPAPPERVCFGTLLSRAQYLQDVEVWKYRDGRLNGRGAITAEQIRLWTNAIGR